jgi:hypothetical protein
MMNPYALESVRFRLGDKMAVKRKEVKRRWLKILLKH